MFVAILWNLSLFVVGLLVVGYSFVRWRFGHWKRRNIPHLEPRFPTGSLSGFSGREHPIGIEMSNYHTRMKPQGHRYVGFYMMTNPALMILDPELIRRIFVKDFDHFVNHGVYYNEKDDPLSAHLFSLEDEKWRNLRARLTPTFTSGKMKMMFPTLLACATPLQDTIADLVVTDEALDIKELVACFTTDVIGSCAFGLDCNSFKEPDGDFRKYGKKIFDINFKAMLRVMFCNIFPDVARSLGVRFADPEAASFFMDILGKTVALREKSNTYRKDFLQLLLELKNNQGSLTFNELAAQAFLFFAAGFETSSTTLTFCFYELVLNQDVQEKLRQEIMDVVKGGEMTYDSMSEMKYMDQVINETLRKYPPFVVHSRRCNKPYPIPESDYVIEKGTKIIISAWALHYDPEYFPEPEKFNPERFSEENKASIVPFTYLPFGDGPRICIGARFANMQIKVALVSILSKFRLLPHENTPAKLRYHPDNFVLTSKDTIFIKAERL